MLLGSQGGGLDVDALLPTRRRLVVPRLPARKKRSHSAVQAAAARQLNPEPVGLAGLSQQISGFMLAHPTGEEGPRKTFPSRQELLAADRSDLYFAIRRCGGAKRVAKFMQVRLCFDRETMGNSKQLDRVMN